MRKAGRKILSYVLVVALLIGLISSSAYAEEKASSATEISLVDDSVSTGEQSTEEDKWRGLDYALFTSGEEALSFYTYKTNINGSVHTNQDFYYQGTSLRIDGALEATKEITLRTASGEENLFVASKQEQADVLEMPDITKELYSFVKEKGTIYEGNKDFNNENVVIDTPIGIEGSAAFHTTTFLGQGIVYAKDSVTYNVGDMSTPEDSHVFVVSENGNINLNGSNITLNAVLYAPNGCVYINANNVKLNGRIIAKQICINGTIININAGPNDYDMLAFLFKPQIDIVVEGNQKVNRKVTLQVKEGPNTQYMVGEETVWNITRDDGVADDLYVIDSNNSSACKKELIFKEAGTYTVEVTVSTGKADYTVSKEIVIVEDMSPVAGFELDSDYYRRNEEGFATVDIKDRSTSLDGDTIGQRVWTIYYDENNDGAFDECEASILNDGNETEITFETEKVGKYKLVLHIVETFDDTISKLLDENAFLSDDTAESTEQQSVFEVGNEAPLVDLCIEKSKSVDVVFTVGDTDKDSMDVYNAKAKSLSDLLVDKGIDAKVETVSTSTYTAQDTFAWKEYGHNDCDGLKEHIMYKDSSIIMEGYYSLAIKDFLYIANDSPGQKTFEFDLQKDHTDWHSMEGGGFLFNTTVDEENNTIKGFCILVTRWGLKLIRIDCDNLQGFRDGSYYWMQYAGEILQTVPIANIYDNHHFKIVVDNKKISVWDGETLSFDNFILPDNDYGYGFGPITSYLSHACGQRSAFTFQNICMQTTSGNSLSDIVDGYGWRPGASHYVYNLSNTEVPELASDEATAELAAALIKNDASFIGIGNDTNKNQYLSLINVMETGGMYLPIDGMSGHMDDANTYIMDSVLAKKTTIEQYITTDDIVTYKGYYQDTENDDIYEQQWEYEYDPSIFSGAGGSAQHIVRNESEPITVFENPGAYSIRLNIRDNPVGENDALDEYRKWSGTQEYEKLLIVHRRPKAQVSVEISENTSDPKTCIAKLMYSSEDPDHPDDRTKGIREEYFWYKNVKDGSWTEGRIPNKLTVGETYLVKYQVKDAEGTWSFPAVAVVKTSDLLVYEEIIDTVAPEIYIDVAKEEIKVGEELRIDGFASDDYGIESFYMYIDGEKVLDTFGRIRYTGKEEGTVTIKAVATDIGGNTSQRELTISVRDDRDKMAPTAEITAPAPGSEIGFDVQIRGSAKDETTFSKYTLSYKEENEKEYHVFKESTNPVDNDILGSLDITELTQGAYEILLTAEDVAGNVAYYGIMLYIENGVSGDYVIEGKLTKTNLNDDCTRIEIIGTAGAQGHMKQYTLSYQLDGEDETVVIAEGTEEVDNGTLGFLATEGLKSGLYNLFLTVEDTQGHKTNARSTFEYAEGKTEMPTPGDPVKKFAVALSHSTANIGTQVQVQVTLPDNIREDTLKISMGSKELATGTRKASFTSEKTGKVTITAIGTDIEGKEQRVSAECTFFNDKDKTAPTAKITSPDTDRILTQPVDITGSAYDESALDFWKLEYRMKGDRDYQLLAEGTEAKKEEVFARFDTTMLMNGQYEMRLLVQDQGGNLTKIVNDYVVEGELKVGAMHIGFTDITAPMGGTTVSVNRMYDSRNKAQGDFGYGWNLGMQGMTLSESGNIAEGYQLIQSGSIFSTGYQMTETINHDVVVTYGDGTSDRFELTFSPEKSALVPISEVELGYRCVTSQKAKLEILGDTTAYVVGTEIAFYEESMYDTLNYRLTTEEGNEVYLNSKKGVYKIVDTSGNVIRVDGNGYHSEDGKSITFTRDSRKRITKAADPNGNTTTYTYDDSGDLISVTDSADRTVSFTYDKKHNLMSITDPMGIAVARNEYDDDGRLVATIDADGNRVEYDYDVEGRTELVSDRLGNKTLYVYDDNGNILSTTDANGNTTKSTYDSFGNVLTKTDAKGNTTTYAYDENGNLSTLTDANGTILKNTYNADNKVTSMATVEETEIIIDYDKNGHLSGTKDAEGNETTYTNDKNGNITGMSDELGQVLSAKYDADGNVIESTDSAGNRTVHTYDANGNVLTKTTYAVTEEGTKERTITYVYNDADEIVQTVDADGNVTSVERNDNGQMTATVDSQNRRTEYEYDSLGNVIKIVYSDGTSESFEYDAEGRNTKSTDRLGLSVTYTYDKTGNLMKQTDARGNETSYTYDKNYNLLTVTSPTGAKTSYTYDSLNRNTSITDADGNVTSFAYNDLSLQTATTDAKGNVTKYEYDKNGSRTKVIYADGSYVQTQYDERGRTIRQKDMAGRETEYTYDSSDRLVSVKQNNGSVTGYSYDQTGNLTGITDANGNTTTYVYDENSRRIKTILADGAENACEYDSQGMLTASTDYNGVKTTYRYDEEDRLIKQVTGTVTTTYAYDSYGRLTDVKEGTSHISYRYNRYGELSDKTYENGQKVSYEYDAYGRLSGISVSQNSKTVTSTKYGYDSMNRLTRVVAHDGTATVYTYDANGNRETATFANGEVLTFTYDELNRLVLQKEVDRNGTIIAQYSYTLGKGGERTKVTETGACGNVETSYDYDSAGRLTKEVIEKNDGQTTYIYTYDAVGNRLSKRENGEKTTYTYNSRNQPVSETYDGVSDLYYLRARYMSTGTGTFISMDTHEGSIYDPDTLHKYLYANANPVMYTDPSGNMFTLAISAIATSLNNILTGVQAIHLNAILRL